MPEHSKKDPFQNIAKANKCDVAWKEMEGSDRVRTCPECTFRVYDFAELSESEVAKLLAQHEKLEVSQMFLRDDGKYMLKNCPPRQSMLTIVTADRAWERFAYATDGVFKPGWQQNDLFKGGWTTQNTSVTWPYGDSQIVLQVVKSTDDCEFTVFRAVYSKPTGVSGDFHFKVYSKTFLSDLSKKFFGAQDIIVGDDLFDERMMIQGNNEATVRGLFRSDQLRNLMLQLSSIECFIDPSSDRALAPVRSSGSSALVLRTLGLVLKERDLQNSLTLVQHMLDRLKELGLAV